MDRLDPVLRWLRDVLPAELGVSGGPINQPAPSLYPREEAVIALAVAKRRYEFRAGRLYAREALSQIGCPPSQIGRNDGGDPDWPPGFIGSISHTDAFAVAVAARSVAFTGIGLDMEADAALDAKLVHFVCRPYELASACEASAATRIFVAKEAYIKAHYSMTKRPIDFLDIQVGFDKTSSEFKVAEVSHSATSGRPEPVQLKGRLECVNGMVVAVVYV